MHLFSATALAFTILVTPFHAQDAEKTHGFPNGRFWTSLPETQKSAYIIGIWDGEAIADFRVVKDTLIHQEPEGFLAEDYVKILDAFYKEPANVRVPIVFAYEFAVRKLKGTPPDELASFEAYLCKYR